MPVNMQNFKACIRVDTGNIVSLLMNSKPRLKFISRGDCEVVPCKIIIKVRIFNGSSDVHAMPLEFPFSLASFHDGFHDVKVTILLYYSRLRLRI